MVVLFVIYWLAVAGLFLYGINCYVLVFSFRRGRRAGLERLRRIREDHARRVPDEDLPSVTVQLPLYNERFVAGRLIHAVTRFDYPRDKLEVQILDDSNDETVEIVAEMVAYYRREGFDIVQVRRDRREGYKAGALRDGLRTARGELVAIFDADFVPEPDFLRLTVPYFGDAGVGLVQTRWGHVNEGTSMLTRTQAIAIDGHFGIEQPGRRWGGMFLNFNGTAGLWRRRAIDDAGGWRADTLTEDLDLSYRAQLRGWRIEYLPDVVVPAEIPAEMSAFKAQQRRWAKGSIQTARKLLRPVLAGKATFRQKAEALIHLTHYFVHPFMLTIALLAVPLLAYWDGKVAPLPFAIMVVLLAFSAMGPSFMYLSAQRSLYPDWKRRLLFLPALVVLGTGISVSNTKAVLEALLGIKSGFVRTPKRALAGSRRERRSGYRLPIGLVPLLEVGFALYATLGLYLYLQKGKYLIGPFLLLYALGFGTVAFASIREAWRRRREQSPEVDPLETAGPVVESALAYAEVVGAIGRKSSRPGYVREQERRIASAAPVPRDA